MQYSDLIGLKAMGIRGEMRMSCQMYQIPCVRDVSLSGARGQMGPCFVFNRFLIEAESALVRQNEFYIIATTLGKKKEG